jgi:hypothetical protein
MQRILCTNNIYTEIPKELSSSLTANSSRRCVFTAFRPPDDLEHTSATDQAQENTKTTDFCS